MQLQGLALALHGVELQQDHSNCHVTVDLECFLSALGGDLYQAAPVLLDDVEALATVLLLVKLAEVGEQITQGLRQSYCLAGTECSTSGI